MVTFDRIEGGRLYYRNPWGKTTLKKGASRNPPGSRVEDANGLESIAKADFQKRAKHAVTFSTDAASNPGAAQ